MKKTDEKIDALMKEALNLMPEGPLAGKVASAIGLLLKSAEVPPETAWCALAMLASDAEGCSASMMLSRTDPDDATRRVLVGHDSDGQVTTQPCVKVGEPPVGGAKVH